VSTRSLPRSAPSVQGVAASGLIAFVDALEAATDIEPHSVMLVRHGQVIAEGWWTPYTPDRLHLLYSLSKSFTSTAAGLAVAEGLLSLDDTVLSHFPELDADVTDPRSRRMLVRHVASMASGHREETLETAQAADPTNLVRGFLRTPPEEEPGTVFAYNQPCTYTLAAIVARRSGSSLTEYLRARLLDPLSIGTVCWQRDDSGRELGYSGLHATTEDVARLGLLYLRRGAWEGRQLLPLSWVEQATRAQVDNHDQMENPDWQQGYGFQFWVSRHGYRGDGAFGQFCVVLPEQDAVLAMTAATENMQGILDLAWEHLLPALSGGSTPSPDDDAVLATRLASLALPRVEGAPQPAERTAESWSRFEGTTTDAQPLSVALTPDGTTWRLVVHVADGDRTPWRFRLPLGTSGWAVAEPPGPDGAPVPLATSGGWTDPQTLRFDLLMLETPHRLQLRCHLTDRVVTRSWQTAPLWDAGMHELRAPRYQGRRRAT
jgi:CubicO group peptidase (beta-lactamase class C family)